MTPKSLCRLAKVTLIALLPVFSAVHAEVSEVTVIVKGMSCPFCAFGVEKRLKTVEGVGTISVDMREGVATLNATAGRSIEVEEVPAAVEKSGFTPGEIRMSVTGILQSRGVDEWTFQVSGSEQSFQIVGIPSALKEDLQRIANKGEAVELKGIYQVSKTAILG